MSTAGSDGSAPISSATDSDSARAVDQNRDQNRDQLAMLQVRQNLQSELRATKRYAALGFGICCALAAVTAAAHLIQPYVFK